jgi:uridine phosphorylase
MMDLFVREVRSVVDGQLAIVRFGSCGTIGEAKVGDMIVQSGAFAVTRNYNYFSDTEEEESAVSIEKPYNFTKVFYADSELSKEVESQLLKSLDKKEIFTGLNATCDSFYSSQGRHDENFRDYNSDLLSKISETYPDTVSLEMETFMLFHLAKASVPLKDSDTLGKDDSIKAASAGMVFTDRKTNEFIDPERIQYLQKVVGKAMLNALVEIKLKKVHPNNEDVIPQ